MLGVKCSVSCVIYIIRVRNRFSKIFSKFLAEFHVDVIVVDPVETGAVRQARENSSTLRSLLRPAFEKDEYVIYTVERGVGASATKR